eukprot:scaffold265564_cov21-Tisochrysis_lutea.AAC.1
MLSGGAESHGKGSLDASPVATVGVAPGGVTSMRTATATATEKVLEESSQVMPHPVCVHVCVAWPQWG